MDRHGIEKAAVISGGMPSSSDAGAAGFAAGNDLVLAAAHEHPSRLLPFVALDLAENRPEDLAELRRRGACGVKSYAGHQEFHRRPIDDPAHAPLWAALAESRVPVLIHVNTVRYREEFENVLRSFPGLSIACAHMCGSRTDIGRLESLMKAHPALLFDTSSGSAAPSADAYANLERERDRVVALMKTAPERFLFGSDLVTLAMSAEVAKEWDQHLAANLGLLRAERFSYWRRQPPYPALVPGEYRGLALPPDVLGPVLEGNAKQWLAGCIK
jgi:predicted TIM-barrel fold metal-dependent hydrolase